MYRDPEIVGRFRFSFVFISSLTQALVSHLESATNRNCAISPCLQVVATLRFLATGAFLRVVGDTVGISESSMSRIVHRVCRAIVEVLCKKVIRFPTGDGQIKTARDFHQKSGFPNVSGAIDCTHVPIAGPTENEADYVNRKGFHSLNVQMTSDSSYRITSVVAKWPGSVHDSRIFRDSLLCRRFEEGNYSGLLLGDSGYPCRPFLMTPFINPNTAQEQRFNNSLCNARVCIEQTFGILKRRFPILTTGIRMSPEKACIIVSACAVLHNLALERGEELPDYDYDDEMQQDDPVPVNVVGDGAAFRRHICDNII